MTSPGSEAARPDEPNEPEPVEDRFFAWIEDIAGRTGLTPREAEIARLVARGLSNKQIAAALGISAWTVSTYLRRTYAKLDVHSRAGMIARIAERAGPLG